MNMPANITYPSYPDLKGRVILVTGGASGIGEGHVRAFCATGANVVFIDNQQEAGEFLASELSGAGANCSFIAADLLDLAALENAIAQIRRSYGPVFGLINNAAVDQRQDILDIKPEDFEWMMNVNLRHVVFAAQMVIPHMREIGSGSIVNTSSIAWMRGVPDLALYSSAKAAIVGFTNALARDVGPMRIRVNAIAPGFVSTPRQRSLWHDEAAGERMLARQCLPDFLQPSDIAQAAVFLCSDAGRMITKQCLTVNAGSL